MRSLGTALFLIYHTGAHKSNKLVVNILPDAIYQGISMPISEKQNPSMAHKTASVCQNTITIPVFVMIQYFPFLFSDSFVVYW